MAMEVNSGRLLRQGGAPAVHSTARAAAGAASAATRRRPASLALPHHIIRSSSSSSRILYPGREPSGQRRLDSVTTAAVPSKESLMSGSAYNAKTNSQYWETRPVPVVSRLLVIGAELSRWYAQSTMIKLQQQQQQQQGVRNSAPGATPASLMREMLCRLGPAFIKIGQALSSRPDLLPPAYQLEFERLQDRIPPFPTDIAFAVLEKELGTSVSSLFSSISPEPVAAASLGQVYRATLGPRPGQPEPKVVAVKVQRPGVTESISLDVYILRWAALVLRQVRRLNTDLPKLVDEWASSLFRELDYRTELSNAQRFKELYSHLKEIYVPEVYQDFSTAQVLTMEWIEGVRLRSASSEDRVQAAARQDKAGMRGSAEDLALVEAGVRCSLEQMLEEGFYHADPHPGNLLKMPDGRLAYLDFGMCGSLDRKTREALITSTLHLVNREYVRLADDFVSLGLLPPGSDKNKVVPALTGVFQSALSQGVLNVSFSQLSGNLGRTMYQFNFRIPPYYTLLVRSLTVLEGIALASNPDYKVLGSAYPWIARRLLTDPSPELRSALRAILYGPDGKFRFNRLESLLQEAALSQPSSKPSKSQNPQQASSSTSGSSPGQQQQQQQPEDASANNRGGVLALLLGDEGEFVRDILLDELAKGIDGSWRLAFDASVVAASRAPSLLFTPPTAQDRALLASTTSGNSSSSSSSSSSDSARIASSTETSSSGPSLPQTSQPSASSSSNGKSLDSAGEQDELLLDWEALEQSRAAGGLLVAALPRLSSREDYEQVRGILQLSRAMASLVTARRNAVTAAQDRVTQKGGKDIGQGTNPTPEQESGLPQPLATIEQGSTVLRWLATELLAVSPEMRAQALRLPVELASRVSSRVVARALRSLVGGSVSGSSTSTSST